MVCASVRDDHPRALNSHHTLTCLLHQHLHVVHCEIFDVKHRNHGRSSHYEVKKVCNGRIIDTCYG